MAATPALCPYFKSPAFTSVQSAPEGVVLTDASGAVVAELTSNNPAVVALVKAAPIMLDTLRKLDIQFDLRHYLSDPPMQAVMARSVKDAIGSASASR